MLTTPGKADRAIAVTRLFLSEAKHAKEAPLRRRQPISAVSDIESLLEVQPELS